ncbi:DMT family transporter [Orrella sp. JC864]|uniref:DMT family transporter n=1 Tax=Orrella sp. JC864 TaxID=3120298 RepID=UPI0012BC9264
MSQPFKPGLLACLLVPPLLWASNAIVGKLAAGLIAPVTLNTLRWTVAWLVLAPFVATAMRRHAATLRAQALPLAVSAFWGITAYNALQYLALTLSSPISTSLIGASAPVLVLLIGRLGYGAKIGPMGALGALVSIAGVIWVMVEGDAAKLRGLAFSAGDLVMLAATLAWSVYTWRLRTERSGLPAGVLLGAQILAGVLLSLPLVALEQAYGGYGPIRWDGRTLAIVAYVGVMPSLVAIFCWRHAVSRTSAQLPVFFMNLTPIFTVLLSAAMLRQYPQAHHYAGLALILAGIVLAQRDTASGR